MRLDLRRRRPAPPSGLPGVDTIEVTARHLRVGDGLRATYAVTGYPREVRLGWLEPVVTHPGPVDVALHVDPMPNAMAADHLRRQLARLESSRRISADKGRLADPGVEAAAGDAQDLADRIARGEGRLFRTGVYATVRGSDVDDLAEQSGRIRAVLGATLLDTAPATFRQLAGWLTTLPLGLDLLRMRRVMDTDALAASFPFASADLPDTRGVLYGLNLRSRGLVCWDRFRADNHNLVILAKSGGGKSYLAKLDALRWAYTGVEVLVVDPDGEYGPLAESVGGSVIRLGAAGVKLNPFDLAAEDDARNRRSLFVHTLIGVLLKEELTAAERAALDTAILAAYDGKGITADPRTHRAPAPLLADVVAALNTARTEPSVGLARKLVPFTSGAHRMLFDAPTTTRPDGHFVVFSLRDLPEELQPAGTLLALDAIWRTVSDPAQRRRRVVVVDEAWSLMANPDGARFLQKLAKSARKHWAGLTVVTQDPEDLLATPLGLAVVQNAATQVLLGQAPQAIHTVADAFDLSDGEARHLLAAQPGEGLLCTGAGRRVAFRSLASREEAAQVVTGQPRDDA